MRQRPNAKRICRPSASKNGGFTLIEMMISMALIAVIAALAYTVLFQGISHFTAESEEVEAQSNVRYALSYLSRQIRKGESVSVVDPYNAYGAALCVDDTYYYYHGQMVYEKRPSGSPIPLVAGIAAMNLSQSESRITMTITSIADSRGHTVTETMEIFLRE
jgi:prepilin-type N-terminal cleavage/methylation domain-containing protein